MVWGIFPDFYPEENISYESHFWGLAVGSLLAYYYRMEGPQRKKYNWEIEEELEEQAVLEEENEAITINYDLRDPNEKGKKIEK
jgi:hypothetical protein